MPQLSKKFLSAQQLVSDNVADAIAWVRKHGIHDDVAGSIEMVLAEALNNIVEHAYLYRAGEQIEMDLILGADALELTLTDQGEKLPGIPQKREMKVDASRMEALPEGGVGWFWLSSFTESI